LTSLILFIGWEERKKEKKKEKKKDKLKCYKSKKRKEMKKKNLRKLFPNNRDSNYNY